MRKINVPEATKGSWEHYLHTATNGNDCLLMMNKLKDKKPLSDYMGHRAIGVVYNPEHEKFGNYVPSILPKRYDAFVFLDKTSALHPINIKPEEKQIPETYPFGM